MRRIPILLIAALLLASPASAQEGQSVRARLSRPSGSTPDPGGGGAPNTIAISELLTEGSTANASSYETMGTFALANGRLGLCGVTGTRASTAQEPTGLTQTGNTWVPVGTVLHSSLLLRTTVFRAMGVGASAATVTVTFAGNQTGAIVQCYDFTNPETSGSDGAGAIAQFVTGGALNDGDDLNAGSTLAIPLTVPSPRAEGSALIAFYGSRVACTWTAPIGFTAGTDGVYATPTTEATTSRTIGGATQIVSTTASSCGAAKLDWVGIAVEVLPSAAGGDVSRPACVITAPTSAPTATTSTAAVTVSGTCTDNDLSTVGITCPACAVAGSITGTDTFTSDHTLTCTGGAGTANVFTVTGTDGAANTGTDVLTITCQTVDTQAPALSVLQPATSPTTVGTASRTISGTTTDNTATTSVTVSCPSTTCTPDSLSATLTLPSWTAVIALECSTGAGTSNVVRSVAADAAGNMTTVDRTVICATADADAPSIAITASSCAASGANCAQASTTVTLAGTASDAVGLRATNPVTGSSPGCSPATWNASGAASWTTPGGGVTCPPGATIHTVTATDASGNTANDTVTITVTPAVTITTTVLPGGQVGDAYIACVNATGGTSPYAWSVSAGTVPTSTSFNAAMSTSLQACFSGTASAANTFNFTIRIVDANMVAATRQYQVIVVAAGAEGPHDYYTNLIGLGSLFFNRSFRDIAQIPALLKGSAAVPTHWSYVYPGAMAALCTGGSCNDSFASPQDGMKLTIPAGQGSIPSSGSGSQQLTIPGRGLGWNSTQLGEGHTALITWDVWWGPNFRYQTSGGAVTSWKAYQIRWGGDGTWTLMENRIGADPVNTAEASVLTDELRAGQDAFATGVISQERLNPAGPGTFPQNPPGGTYQLSAPIYHSQWTRYVLFIEPCIAAASFTEWNAAYGVTVGANAADDPLTGSTGCTGGGKWNRISKWVITEDGSIERVIYRAPITWDSVNKNPWVQSFLFEHNASPCCFLNEQVQYMRNLVVLRDYSLSFPEPETDTVIFKAPKP